MHWGCARGYAVVIRDNRVTNVAAGGHIDLCRWPAAGIAEIAGIDKATRGIADKKPDRFISIPQCIMALIAADHLYDLIMRAAKIAALTGNSAYRCGAVTAVGDIYVPIKSERRLKAAAAFEDSAIDE